MSEASVADELAIRQLVSRYCDAVARRDADAWAETWAEDGEWVILGRTPRGRGEVRAHFEKLMATVPFVVQLPYGGIIETQGERASGRWYVTEHAKGADGTPLFMIGVYRDEYVREGGAWRFGRRRIDVLYMGPPDLTGITQSLPEEA